MAEHGGGRSDLPSVSVRRPVLALVMNLLIVLAGLAALSGVEVRELPNIERPIVTIRVDFPGAAPETMDAEVTRILEGAAARVPGVQAIASASEENNARVRVYFDPSVDINIAANDVREQISQVTRSLPDGIENVFVVKANDDADPIMRLSASSDALTAEQLTQVVDDEIIPELLGVPGVADVQIYGNQGRVLYVVVEPAKLASHSLGVDDLAAALARAQFDVPAGSYASAGQDLLVRADATVIEEEAIERLTISGNTRVGDVATVRYGPAEATSYVRLDGRPVLSLGVIRQAQSNTIEISDGIQNAIAGLNERMRDVHLQVNSDDAVFIRGAVTEVLLTLALGTAIVISVIMLFLGSPRLTLIPAVTIPVALIGTLAAIWMLGFSINILTLLAMVLATGMVVDDAIVVLENIERHRRLGEKRLAAAVLGTREVFFAVIATTVTLASVFVPIAFLPGDAGQLFTEFGFVLAIAVVISSFVALSLVPMMGARLTRDPDAQHSGAMRRMIAGAGRKLASLYEVSLAAALRAPILMLGLSLALVSLAVPLFLSLDRELVPDEDRGAVIVSLRGPDGANLDYSDRQVAEVEALMQPYVASGEATGLLAIVGRWDPNRGVVIMPLAPWGERRPQAEIVAELRPHLDRIPGALASVYNPNSLSIRTSGSDLEFALTGPDHASIAANAELLLAAIEQRVPTLTDVSMDFSATQPQLMLSIDRERAADLGVDIDAIATTLRAMVDGAEIADLNVGDETVPIVIESTTGAVDATDDLMNLQVVTADRRMVPLSSLVTIEERAVAGELNREGQRRAIEIEATLAEGAVLSEAVDAVQAVAAEMLPVGIGLIFLGEAEAQQKAARDTAITFALALAVVLLVLAAQFESFASAFVVMITVPFGLGAAVLALWASGTTLNVYSQIGLVMLVGLMAKNGILIVEFANQLRDRGLDVADAVYRGALLRLRPVSMTMLSTTLAGLPLILSGGAGSEAREAIGWVVFGGVGIAIVATLYVTPVAYLLIAPLARSRGDAGRDMADQLADAARRDNGRHSEADDAISGPRPHVAG